ncbi:MAG: TlpA family protein disulfide reductase, partial [Gemmatimonadetes bacterium]|nr:TlpA family protein disulfide reductase [Gemmatimonadota bacterium]
GLVGGLGVLLLALLLVRGLSGASAAGGVPLEGQPAPDLATKTLAGEKVALSDLRGKVVLVNFWATWCPPCRAEMPGFERVWKDKRDAGFVVMGLSADETGSRGVAKFLRDQGITYPVGMASAAAKAAYGGVNGLPMSFLVDRQGVVQRVITGLYDESLLRRDVSRLLRLPS